MPTPWPRLESDDYLMSAGSARPLEDAFRIAQHDLVTWIASECGLDPLDGYQLVTQASESPIANVCDPNYTVVAKIRKSYLPAPRRVRRHAHPAARDECGLPVPRDEPSQPGSAGPGGAIATADAECEGAGVDAAGVGG